jgi:hypothetical protein
MGIKEIIEEKLIEKTGYTFHKFVCKVCGETIELGLCGYGCVHDNTELSERPKGSVAKVTYKFEKVEDM